MIIFDISFLAIAPVVVVFLQWHPSDVSCEEVFLRQMV